VKPRTTIDDSGLRRRAALKAIALAASMSAEDNAERPKVVAMVRNRLVDAVDTA